MPLDIRRLARAGALVPGRVVSWQWTVNDCERGSIQICAEGWHVELVYNYTPRDRPAEVIRQTVMLETTPCTLGGRRSWFSCPTCARRVAVIYGAGRLFACRQCKRLAYASQGESAADRALRRAERIRKKLGWVPGVAHGHGLKPVGMHWATFDRLRHRHDRLAQVWLIDTSKWLRLMRSKLGAGDNMDLVL